MVRFITALCHNVTFWCSLWWRGQAPLRKKTAAKNMAAPWWLVIGNERLVYLIRRPCPFLSVSIVIFIWQPTIVPSFIIIILPDCCALLYIASFHPKISPVHFVRLAAMLDNYPTNDKNWLHCCTSRGYWGKSSIISLWWYQWLVDIHFIAVCLRIHVYW